MNSTKLTTIENKHQLLTQISHDLLNSLTLVSCSYQFIESQHPEVKGFQYWSELKTDLTSIQHYLTGLAQVL